MTDLHLADAPPSASPPPTPHRHRRRFAPLMWISGALAALLLILGVTGTLSSWTTAIITNDTNTAQAAGSVILTESDGTNTCASSAEVDNTYTCSTINKYGGVVTPLVPGASQTQSVTLSNTGTDTGDLTLDAGACTNSNALAGAPDLCGELQVTVECPAGTTVFGPGTLTAFDALAAPSAVATLDAGDSVVCQFTVTLPVASSPTYAGQAVSQPLVWTLSA